MLNRIIDPDALLAMLIVAACVVLLAWLNFAYAGGCEDTWDGLVGNGFGITFDEDEYSLTFGDSAFGPCPSGVATLKAGDDVIREYQYHTDPGGFVAVDGLADFYLAGDSLILITPDMIVLDRR